MRAGLPLLLVAILCGGCGGDAPPAQAPATEPATLQLDWIELSSAYVRPSLPPHSMSAGFFTLHNLGAEDLSLVAVSTPRAGRTELHTMKELGGMMRMRPVNDFQVPIGGELELAPGGNHLMFFELDRPWQTGEVLPLRLTFADGHELELEVPVLDPDA